MNSQLIKPITILGAAVPVICFFLPWASVELKPVNFLNKLFNRHAKTEIVRISGFDIPCMANRESSKEVQSVVKVFVSDAENADKKSYLVWFVPIMAIILACLTRPAAKNTTLAICVGVAGVVIFLAATIKILVTRIDNMAMTVHISPAFWLTLLAYLALGILNIHQYMHHKRSS